MRKFNIVLPIVLASVALFSSGVTRAANVLAQYDVNFGFGPPGVMYFVFSHDVVNANLFQDIPITSSTIGHRYSIDAGTAFSATARFLTNGIDNNVLLMQYYGPNKTGGGTWRTIKESQLLGASGHPDLIGRRIDAIALTVVNYRPHPIFTDLDSVDLKISIMGVPEPASAALASIVAFGWILRRR